MCIRDRSSTLSLPERWLSNPSLIESESARDRKAVWKILWSVFSRCQCGKKTGVCSGGLKCQHHPDDREADLGDRDHEQFQFMLRVFAQLLEGRSLMITFFLFNPRGRNSKGTLHKLMQKVMGSYMAIAGPNIFNLNTRNENEHNAAEASRDGCRVAWGNEVNRKTPWNTQVFKTKNSTDTVELRGCGSGNVVSSEHMMNYVFGANVPPKFDEHLLHSELNRICPIRLPNKFNTPGERPRSP